jgi:hypothetical protein
MDQVEETTPLKVALFESLRQQLVGYDFKLNARNDNFLRLHDGFTDIFQITCLDGKPGYRIRPGVGVRIERVEEIFHQTSGIERKYRKGTPTMGAPVGALLGENDPRSCDLLLDSYSEVASVTEKIMGVFCEHALPYFEHWGSLQAIDAELNDNPGERRVHWALAWLRCSTGIIVAKLLGRPDYEQLAAFYTEVMTRDNKGFYLKRFLALLESLKRIEPERE